MVDDDNIVYPDEDNDGEVRIIILPNQSKLLLPI